MSTLHQIKNWLSLNMKHGRLIAGVLASVSLACFGAAAMQNVEPFSHRGDIESKDENGKTKAALRATGDIELEGRLLSKGTDILANFEATNKRLKSVEEELAKLKRTPPPPISTVPGLGVVRSKIYGINMKLAGQPDSPNAVFTVIQGQGPQVFAPTDGYPGEIVAVIPAIEGGLISPQLLQGISAIANPVARDTVQITFNPGEAKLGGLYLLRLYVFYQK
jgi:hypothetical protein